MMRKPSLKRYGEKQYKSALRRLEKKLIGKALKQSNNDIFKA